MSAFENLAQRAAELTANCNRQSMTPCNGGGVTPEMADNFIALTSLLLMVEGYRHIPQNGISVGAGSFTISQAERLQLFYARMRGAPAAGNADDALSLINRTLNGVEDTYSGVINMANPPKAFIGRMFSIQSDNITRFSNGSLIARTKGQRILISNRGSIIMKGLDGRVIFRKAGAL